MLNAMEVSDPRLRAWWLFALFAGVIGLVWGWAVLGEARWGDRYRAAAVRPLERIASVPAARGRILARDGTILAEDRSLQALAVHYRWLQTESDPAWLRATARTRLPKPRRRDRASLLAEEERVRADVSALHLRLTELCGWSPADWNARTSVIEARIETMAAAVNGRRLERHVAAQRNQVAADEDPLGQFWLLAAPEEALPEGITIAEQTDFHILVENVASKIAAAVLADPDRFPGTRIVEQERRVYPQGNLAATTLGHLQGTLPKGAMGIEGRNESRLAGHPGKRRETLDYRGRVLGSTPLEPAIPGADITLTLVPEVQRTAEALLDEALSARPKPKGGAIVVLDIADGTLLALASAPRFDPNAFALQRSTEIERVLNDPTQPLFDRPTRMALPAGELGKLFPAVAKGESQPPVTPLSVARAVAAIASGGRAVTPSLVVGEEMKSASDIPIPSDTAIHPLREEFHANAAHETLRLETVDYAVLPATGETGTAARDHAWCAGFAPYENPRLVFVVALEHGGNGLERAGPLAKQLVRRLRQLGWVKSQ